ncbi:hypothetical protein FFLO_04754 [Filobasidium floriforme]|uniref:Uncharacterized protein n=1 Tax=Filobasidium floriforme TaxID=5210 RepID=A0A8K0JJJ0_9TREE|nr:uncharacterized protein HD553DRAFT_324841 [Filobasidium floriforme]KAG7530847.1 hypothetical protein FFLO_04754 [Filobasidium floriforme]KAH8082542.1 hypothetical protein HD553DRAFT_324841 [Filobasidium floriforme]
MLRSFGERFISSYTGTEMRSTISIETEAEDVKFVDVTLATENSSQVVRSVQTESGIEISEQTYEALSRATWRQDSKKPGTMKKLSPRKKAAIKAYYDLQTAARKWFQAEWPNCDEEMPTHFRGGLQVKYHVVTLMYKYWSEKDTGKCLKPLLICTRTVWTPDHEELKWILQQAADYSGGPADIDRRNLILWINGYTALQNRRKKAQRNPSADPDADEIEPVGIRVEGGVC